ncbi:MAG: hypothetical protein ACT4PY_07515 [Armatimonadota bacterium]
MKRMDRRAFLRKAGVGSIALASLPSLIDSMKGPAEAQAAGTINYHFACLAVGGPQGAQPAGTPAAPQHVLIISGDGSFDPTRVASPVSGGGMYVHFTFPGAAPPPGGTPLPVVASGTWGNGRFTSYAPNRTFGVQGTGVLNMVVDLFQEMPAKRVIRGAALKVVCVAGPAGVAIPGELEGITLSVPGTDFSTGGAPGPFTPTGGRAAPGPGLLGAPGVGITLFSIVPIPK